MMPVGAPTTLFSARRPMPPVRAAQAGPGEIGQGQGDGAFQGGGGGQPGADRDIGGRRDRSERRDRDAGAFQRPGHAGRIRGPAGDGVRDRRRRGRIRPGPSSERREASRTVRSPGPPRPRWCAVDGERQDEAVVVVSVFADQVDPSRCLPDAVGRRGRSGQRRRGSARPSGPFLWCRWWSCRSCPGVPEPGRDLFGSGVVDEGAHGGLGAGQELEFVRGPPRAR